MKALIARLMPGTLAARILLALLLTFALSQAGTFLYQQYEHAALTEVLQKRASARSTVALIKVLGATADPEERWALLDKMKTIMPHLTIERTELVGSPRNPHYPGLDRVADDLGPTLDAALLEPGVPEANRLTDVIVTLPDGSRLRFAMVFGGMSAASSTTLVLSVLLVAGLLVLLGWLAISLSSQIRKLAAAAARFTPEQEGEPFPVSGPTELRILAESFNAMRERISLLMDNQTLALTAVGHDLRSPITRMRMRAEHAEPGPAHDANLRDIAYMEGMINNVLSLLQGDEDRGRVETTDLAAILEAVCDDFTDAGGTVTYAGPERATIKGRSEDLVRLFSNLVANACRHSQTVRVSLVVGEGGSATVHVDDDGPGIAPERRADMLKAFQRGAASHPGSGLGLGLFIAQTIAEAHGGSFALRDSPMGGLQVRVALSAGAGPLAPAPLRPRPRLAGKAVPAQ